MRARIAVVGGGLAGIAAALECGQAGADVTLLESRGRLGGAVYSFTRDGLRVDNGQHVFLRCCTAYIELLQRIGAWDLVTLQPRLRIPVLAPGGRRAVLARSDLPAPLHLAGSLLRYRHLGLSERLSVARAMRALDGVDRDDPVSDARSFGAWLADHGQSPRAREAMWELIVRPTLNLRARDASLAQAAQVFQDGLTRSAAAADVGYARGPLSEIHDVAARRALDAAGVDVRLRAGVTALARSGHAYRLQTAAGPLEADAVIVAVPPRRAAALLPDAAGVRSDRLSALGRSPIVNLHVIYDRRVLFEPFAATVDSPLQWIFDRTASSGLGSGQYLAVSLSAAEEELAMAPGELQARYLPALSALLDTEARVEAFFVTREHSATFRARPGARALRPSVRTALPGLFLAGAWTDTGWPATMEGAVRSGHAAAHAALGGAAPAAAAPAAASPALAGIGGAP